MMFGDNDSDDDVTIEDAKDAQRCVMTTARRRITITAGHIHDGEFCLVHCPITSMTISCPHNLCISALDSTSDAIL